jgi:putative oxidoreductase
MKIFVLLGRILFCLIFLTSSIGHFSAANIQYSAAQGVPIANVLVPVSGVIAALGALSIILGYKARIGAFLIIIFLLPVTFIMHPFWVKADPAVQQMQLAMFMKNISMLGAAVLIGYFGSGPMSLDEKYVEDSPLV